MSTDSTELTFVRCPSCRSLVPAVSTRCRMCGATLDPAAQSNESADEQKRSGRVRQRTMSQSHSELNDAAGQVRKDMQEAPVDEDPFGLLDDTDDQDESGDVELADNPLGEYMDEDELASKSSNGERVSGKEANGTLENKPVQATAAHQPPATEQREEQKAKVTVESGPRQAGRPSSLNFGKGREQSASGSTGERAVAPEINRQQDRKHEAGRFNKPPQQNAPQQGAPRAAHSEKGPGNTGEFRNRPQVQERSERQERDRPVDRQERHEKPAGHSQQREELRVEETYMTGRLCGWLVSYDRPEGSAIELREGKFFITGSQLKKNDLVLEGKGLSTPHSMVFAGAGQLRIQDLMSDSGLYIKKKNRDSFQREEGTIQVEHGDWVKFGQAEFLVALVSVGK